MSKCRLYETDSMSPNHLLLTLFPYNSKTSLDLTLIVNRRKFGFYFIQTTLVSS